MHEFGWLADVEAGDVASWASLVFSVLTAIAASAAFVSLRTRERRQALTDLHISLTTGETAAARNTIGTLLYSTSPNSRPGRIECISAYFALIWAVQRARNVFRAQLLPTGQLDSPISRWESVTRGRRMKDAAAVLSWNLTEIADNLVQFHDLYAADWDVQDEDAWTEIGEYVNADSIRKRVTTVFAS